MATQLMFVHGRAQENKDAAELKSQWISAFKRGLSAQQLELPVEEKDIHFPYYGQTLYDFTRGVPVDDAAAVIFRGNAASSEEKRFLWAVLEEARKRAGITDDDVRMALNQADARVVEKGPLNWEWVQGLLKVLDQSDGLSGHSIELATKDVYQYLTNDAFRLRIDRPIRASLATDKPTVVVSHSLGTVVAYSILREMTPASGVRVPLLVTLGSPLGVTAVRSRFEPLVYPNVVGDWFNAMDERDVVALYPLDKARFPVEPAIRNKRDVKNSTENRHGIDGYLDDPEVAREIYEAVKNR